MSEHEMCCGTTCDKQAVAAEIEQLRKERDEALAYAERLRAALNLQLNDCINFDGAKLSDCILEHSTKVLTEQPPAALAALKAELQAEALEAINGFVWVMPSGSRVVYADDIEDMISNLKRAQEDE